MNPISFRNSKIVYYGPHSCENCGVQIAKMGTEWGGTAFTYPEGPIYPNTEWYPHVCDQKLVRQRRGMSAASIVGEHFPQSQAILLSRSGMFVILGEPCSPTSEHALVVSMCSNDYDTEDAAWCGALDRLEKGYPTWHLDLSKGGVHSRKTTESNEKELERLPQMPSSDAV
jgi:hypothetical protein